MARIVAALALAFALLGATAIAHRVQDCEMLKYQRVQPTKHVIVFQAAEGTTGIVNGNIAAVLGSEAFLMVGARPRR
jgi:hypothetical protein